MSSRDSRAEDTLLNHLIFSARRCLNSSSACAGEFNTETFSHWIVSDGADVVLDWVKVHEAVVINAGVPLPTRTADRLDATGRLSVVAKNSSLDNVLTSGAENGGLLSPTHRQTAMKSR
eukprot:PhM_4_TR2104/c0_g1_i1/m.6375